MIKLFLKNESKYTFIHTSQNLTTLEEKAEAEIKKLCTKPLGNKNLLATFQTLF